MNIPCIMRSGRALVLACLAMAVTAGALASTAAAAGGHVCGVYQTANQAVALCNVTSGRVRLKVICNNGNVNNGAPAGPGSWWVGENVVPYGSSRPIRWVTCASGILFAAVVNA